MNEEEKKAVERFKRLYLKDFNNEKITNEDRLSYIECALISNLIEKLQKENEEWQRAYQEEKNKQFDFINKISSNDLIPVQKVKDNLIKYQEEYELLLEHQSGKESNRTKYLRGRIHMCQELLEGRK
nr:MAG TPA: hypothetical protein [Caudoviricetes sp.]